MLNTLVARSTRQIPKHVRTFTKRVDPNENARSVFSEWKKANLSFFKDLGGKVKINEYLNKASRDEFNIYNGGMVLGGITGGLYALGKGMQKKNNFPAVLTMCAGGSIIGSGLGLGSAILVPQYPLIIGGGVVIYTLYGFIE